MATDESLPVDETRDAEPQADAATDADGEDSPWGTLVLGILMIVGAGWIYWYFGKLEAEGGSVRMPAIAWAIYGAIGRTGLAGVVGLLGAVFMFGGLAGVRNRSA